DPDDHPTVEIAEDRNTLRHILHYPQALLNVRPVERPHLALDTHSLGYPRRMEGSDGPTKAAVEKLWKSEFYNQKAAAYCLSRGKGTATPSLPHLPIQGRLQRFPSET